MANIVMRATSIAFSLSSALASALLSASPSLAESPTPSSSPSATSTPLAALPPELSLPAPATPPIRVRPERHHRLEWNPRWHRFRVVEYVTTAATAGAAIGVFLFAKPSENPKWVGPILFDSPVRDAFRLRTRSGIQTALDVSYWTAMVTPAQSLFDSLVLPAIDRNVDLWWQLAMMDAQAYSLSGLVTATLYDTTGRARPSYEDCKSGKSVDPACNSGEFASFPSGHTAQAMTGAGLLCVYHEELPLYGGGAWDVAACVEGITVGVGVGVLRLMADRHYVSDVMVGGAIGFVSGYALPRLLHFWRWSPGELVNRRDFKLAVALGGGNGPLGAQLIGAF